MAGARLKPTGIVGLILLTALLLGVSPGGGHAAPQIVQTDGCTGGGDPAWFCPLTVKVQGSGGFVSSNETPQEIVGCRESSGDCTGTYSWVSKPSFASVTAFPDNGWHFVGWTGSGCEQASSTCRIEMAHAMTVTAIFQSNTYKLTVNLAGAGKGTVTGGGINCPGTCSVDVPANAPVQLTESPDTASGSTFGGWGGSCSGIASTCSVQMTADRTVTATFNGPPVKRTLRITTSGTGTVTGPGINCPGDCSEQYDNGTNVQLTAAPGSGLTTTWSGDCAGTTNACSLTMNSDKSATATFAGGGGGGGSANRTLTVSVNGSGTVTGSGINCPGDCTQDYASGTQVTLTASPAAQYTREEWGGDCASVGNAATCTLAMSASRSAVANFRSTSDPAGDIPSIDGGKKADPLPDKVPPAVEQVIVQVDGTGWVTSSQGARVLAGATATKPINCGVAPSGALKYDCYGEYTPGQTLTLKATPAEGYVFKRWTGACAGSDGPTCRVTTRDSRKASAIFEQGGTGAAVAALLKPPNLRVRWQSSVGAGNLVLRGSTSMAANARIDMRRPGGGPLATRKLKLTGGSFREAMALKNGRLRGGAKLFPGGFTVALTGRAGRLKLPLQMQTISIPAPAEGVVRTAFKSRTQNGKAVTRFPANTTIAWANFRFETQPRLNQKLSVRWYFPDGRRVGEVQKSNRPVISSYLALGTGLDNGRWVAELRAGKRIIQRLSIQVGS